LAPDAVFYSFVQDSDNSQLIQILLNIETRSPKSETILNIKNNNDRNRGAIFCWLFVLNIIISNFGFVSDLEIRYSGFRVSCDVGYLLCRFALPILVTAPLRHHTRTPP